MAQESSGMHFCSKDECPKFFKAHRWGAIAATGTGWFLQRNGQAWCPDHIPDWVDAWRDRKAEKSKEK